MIWAEPVTPEIFLTRNAQNGADIPMEWDAVPLETVQDFLIKFDIKPLMHLMEAFFQF